MRPCQSRRGERIAKQGTMAGNARFADLFSISLRMALRQALAEAAPAGMRLETRYSRADIMNPYSFICPAMARCKPCGNEDIRFRRLVR